MFHFECRAGNNVVVKMRVNRCRDYWLAALDVGQELKQASLIVAFRKAFALHQTARLQDGIWVQEAVGGDERHVGMVRPACQAARKTRENVLLPTATLPAMPMM